MEIEPFLDEGVLYIRFIDSLESIDKRIIRHSGLISTILSLDKDAGTPEEPLFLNVNFEHFKWLNNYYFSYSYADLPPAPEFPLCWANVLGDFLTPSDAKFISELISEIPKESVDTLMKYGNVADYLQMDNIMLKLGATIAFIIKTNGLRDEI